MMANHLQTSSWAKARTANDHGFLAWGEETKPSSPKTALRMRSYFATGSFERNVSNLYVSHKKEPEKLVDVLADPDEQTNLIGSNDPEAQAALTRMSALIASFPERDNDPIYKPNPPQPWDVDITAQSEVWKK